MRVTQAIESVEGVKHARVTYSEKRAEVQSDQCTDAVFSAISEALDDAGYGSTVVSVEPADAI